jgi:hypothetical protein
MALNVCSTHGGSLWVSLWIGWFAYERCTKRFFLGTGQPWELQSLQDQQYLHGKASEILEIKSILNTLTCLVMQGNLVLTDVKRLVPVCGYGIIKNIYLVILLVFAPEQLKPMRFLSCRNKSVSYYSK